MKRYLRILLLAPASIIVTIMTLELVIDPYAQFNLFELENINKFKTSALLNERVYKTNRVNHTRPDFLVLGTSREDFGIDPNELTFPEKAYNGATVSQSYRESRMMLEHLHSIRRFPEHILLGLLYESADIYAPLPGDYNEERLYGGTLSSIKYMFTLNMVRAVAKTVSSNLRGASRNSEGYAENGVALPVQFEGSLRGYGQHQLFKENEKLYFADKHHRLPLCRANALDDPETGYSRLDEIRALVRLAYTEKSDLRLFIGPSHARQWQTIKESGLWEDFEAWKRRIVTVVEEEAIRASATPFQVWDFSGYNSITTEPLPPAGDMAARMKYYYESSHYTPAAGQLVIGRIYAGETSLSVPDDFGVLLNSGNLDQHLAGIRHQQIAWERQHPSDVGEISELKLIVDKSKGCP